MLSPSPTPPLLKIAIYRTSSIGDCVLATATLSLLRRLKVNTRVWWIGRDPTLSLIAAAFPDIVPVEVKREGLALSSSLGIGAEGGIHVIIDLQRNLRSQLICRRLAQNFAARVFGWNKEDARRFKLLLTARIRGRSKPLDSKAKAVNVFRYQMMLEPLRDALRRQLPTELHDGIDDEVRPCLPTEHDSGDRPWQKELKFGSWLAVAPGASFATKKAPTALFVEALRLVRSRVNAETKSQDIGILYLGDGDDRKVALQIMDALDWQGPSLNLAGKLSLWETALAVKEARVLIANDTSIPHMAEAVGVPTAVLFGPTIEGFGFAPCDPASQAFSSDLGCRPCSKHGAQPCRYGDQLCFAQIDLHRVAEFITSLLFVNK